MEIKTAYLSESFGFLNGGQKVVLQSSLAYHFLETPFNESIRQRSAMFSFRNPCVDGC